MLIHLKKIVQLLKNQTRGSIPLMEVHAAYSRNKVNIGGALRDLVAFVQLKNHEKHPWRSVNSSKVAG